MILLIEQGDSIGLVTYLTALPSQGVGHGYFQGKPAFNTLKSNPVRQKECALWFFEHFISLAEDLVVLRVRCSEQGDWNTVPFMSVDELLFLVERKISLPITLPNIFDRLFALESGSGPIHLRSIMATYAVRQIVQFLEHLEGPSPQEICIAEIGVGIGYTALVAHKREIAQHTIYDLHEVNVAQDFFY